MRWCRWDEEISLDAAGDRIEPLHSMAPEWRQGLRSGDLVEVKYENLRWGAGRIAHREGENIRVMDVNDSARLLGVFPISSDMIWYVVFMDIVLGTDFCWADSAFLPRFCRSHSTISDLYGRGRSLDQGLHCATHRPFP
jgi:hypothetical protein